jgi:hypothetical protein
MKFLRLSKMLINPASIRTITMTDTKYTIHFMSERSRGLVLFSSGSMGSSSVEITIDKKENPSDYRMMQCWISKID